MDSGPTGLPSGHTASRASREPRLVYGSPGGFALPIQCNLGSGACPQAPQVHSRRASHDWRLRATRPYLKSKILRDAGVVRGPILREKIQIAH